MKKIKLDINKYKKKDKKLCKTEWQEYAKKTIEKFNIGKKYQPIIWRQAKRNLAFLKAKVINLEEIAQYKKIQLKNYNKLLIYLLTKK